MKIIRLILEGYDRVSLNNIRRIEYTPYYKTQLILGSNGSGKSSLMSELTPLPASSSDFPKKGYKLIEIEHNSLFYRLKSDFTGSTSRFEFICNDEELNPGGTMTVYKDLVKQHFGITQDIHDLMTGKVRFSSMSANERRSWLTRLSGCDFNYALSYFERLKNELRDAQSALKDQSSRLVLESEKLLTPEDEIRYRQEITDLTQFVNELLEKKASTPETTEYYEQQIQSLKTTLTQMSIMVFNTVNANRQYFQQFTSEERCSDAIAELTQRLGGYRHEIDRLCEQISDNDKRQKMLSDNNLQSLSELNHQILSHEESVDELLKRLHTQLVFPDVEKAVISIETISSELKSIFSELKPNPDKAINREYNENLHLRHKEIESLIIRLNNFMDRCRSIIKEQEHLRDHQKVQCPKCDNVWSQGFDEKKLIETQRKLTEAHESSIKAQEDKSKLETEIEETRVYFELFRRFRHLTTIYTSLEPLWEHISLSNKLFTAPRELSVFIDAVYQDSLTHLKIKQLKQSLNGLLELKKLTVDAGSLDLEVLKKDHEALEQKHHRLLISLRTIELDIKGLQTFKKHLSEIAELDNKIKATSAMLQLQQTQRSISIFSNAVNRLVYSIRIMISDRERVISRVDIQKGIVDSLKENIERLKNRIELLKIASDELSPNKGIIARQLQCFTTHFFGQLNSFLRNVWTYPLEIVPVEADPDEAINLDFRFNVKVAGKIIPDANRGSTAIKEGIDLGFRIVCSEYLGINTGPLYFDELGASFDAAHRHAAQRLIESIITNCNHSQVFIISHYEEMYGGFKNCDTNVLCSANVPKTNGNNFNQQMRIS